MNPDRLNGWKEIAAYIGKEERTAQRWEKRGMPVHRVGALDGVVYAFKGEIDTWSATVNETFATTEDGEEPPLSRAIVPQPGNASAPASLGRAFHAVLWVLGVGAVCLLVFAFGRDWASRTEDAELLVLKGPDLSRAPQGHNFVFTIPSAGGARELWRWSRAPGGGEGTLDPPVLPDAQNRIVWVLSTDCLTQTGRHDIAFVDRDGRPRTNVTSIEVQPDTRCSGDLPDLVAEAVKLDTAQVRAGTQVVVARFILRNQGPLRALASVTRLRLGQSAARTPVTDLSLGDVPAPAIESGATIELEHRFVIPAAVADGTYFVWVVADNGGANLETASHNNFARSTALTVLSRTAGDKPSQ